MDPLQAMRDYRVGMIGRDREAIGEAADALVGWLEKGGVNPFEDGPGWEQGLSRAQLIAHLRDVRHVAEM